MSDVEELEQENANLRARLCTMENRVAYLEATPKPDPSPVCVEISRIQWDRSRENWWIGDTPFGRYQIFDGGYSAKWGEYPLEPLGPYGSMEDAVSVCEADFTRRTLELVNARSVESVKAAALTEMRDDLAGVAACYGWSASQSADGPYVSLDDWITEQAAPLIDPLPNDFGEAVQQEWESQIREKARAQGAAEERERLAKLASEQAAKNGTVASGRTLADAAFAARWLAGISS